MIEATAFMRESCCVSAGVVRVSIDLLSSLSLAANLISFLSWVIDDNCDGGWRVTRLQSVRENEWVSWLCECGVHVANVLPFAPCLISPGRRRGGRELLSSGAGGLTLAVSIWEKDKALRKCRGGCLSSLRVTREVGSFVFFSFSLSFRPVQTNIIFSPQVLHSGRIPSHLHFKGTLCLFCAEMMTFVLPVLGRTDPHIRSYHISETKVLFWFISYFLMCSLVL